MKSIIFLLNFAVMCLFSLYADSAPVLHKTHPAVVQITGFNMTELDLANQQSKERLPFIIRKKTHFTGLMLNSTGLLVTSKEAVGKNSILVVSFNKGEAIRIAKTVYIDENTGLAYILVSPTNSPLEYFQLEEDKININVKKKLYIYSYAQSNPDTGKPVLLKLSAKKAKGNNKIYNIDQKDISNTNYISDGPIFDEQTNFIGFSLGLHNRNSKSITKISVLNILLNYIKLMERNQIQKVRETMRGENWRNYLDYASICYYRPVGEKYFEIEKNKKFRNLIKKKLPEALLDEASIYWNRALKSRPFKDSPTHEYNEYMNIALELVNVALEQKSSMDGSFIQKVKDINQNSLEKSRLILNIYCEKLAGDQLAINMAKEYFKETMTENTRRIFTGNPNILYLLKTKGDEIQHIKIVMTNREEVVKAFTNKKSDLILTSGPLNSKEISQCEKNGFSDITSYQFENVVAIDSIAILINRENKIKQMNLSNLRDIFTGAIGNWADLNNGSRETITPYALSDKFSAYHLFNQLVLSQEEKGLHENINWVDSHEEMRKAIASDPNAIGFIRSSKVAKSRSLKITHSTRPAMVPTALSISTEEYALTKRVYCYSRPDIDKDSISDFINLTLSERGQKVVAESDLTPLSLFTKKMRPQWRSRDMTISYMNSVKNFQRVSLNFRFKTSINAETKEEELILDNRSNRDLHRLIELISNREKEKQKKNKRPKTVRLALCGFTERGNPAKTTPLGFKLAKIVAKAIKKINKKQPIKEVSMGGRVPISENNQKNRRVEVWIR